MILESTYQDLKLLLDTLEGVPLDNQKDIVYREAVSLLVKTYEDEEKAWMDGLISSGNFTEGNSQLAKRNLYSLTSIHNDITGGDKIEKDF